MTDVDDQNEKVEIEEADQAESTAPSEDVVDDAQQEDSSTDETDPDTFSREYVAALRRENGKYRQRAQKADALAHRLHTELVRATGKLADPTDLPFDPDHLDDDTALMDAITALISGKPHLAARRPSGDIGQGATAGSGGGVDLAALLRGKAG